MYIGKTPTVGNFQVCDAISVVNGQAAYTLQVGGTNVAPESANHMLVSLNGILQKPGSSFTISGSTMTFASNLATGDVIDFVQILGNVLDIGQPSDDTVTAAKLNNDIISGQTALTAEPDDTDEFLVSDAGTIKRIDYSLIKGGGITMADMWRLSSNLTASTTDSNVDVTANWERADTNGYGNIGSAMSNSSGIFTFPSTGIYQIYLQYMFETGSGTAPFHGLHLFTTTDNSSYSGATENYIGLANNYNSASAQFIFDVTNTSTHKIKFVYYVNASTILKGSTSAQMTGFTIVRLGDT